MSIRFKLVLRHLSERFEELYMSGKKSQRHAENPNVAKLADWRFFFRLIWYILYIYAAFLDLMHVPRSYLQVAMIMIFFLSGCHGISGKYCRHSLFLSISRCPDKIYLKFNHQSPKTLYITEDQLCTAVLTTIFFHAYFYQKHGLLFIFVGS